MLLKKALIRKIRMVSLLIAASLLSVVAIVWLSDYLISHNSEDKIYTRHADLPNYQTALVLGTSKYLGRILNDYYANRIDAAIALYNEQKVNTFLLSGDNAHRSYNEPWTMKRDLLKAGVPEQAIFLDYAGFRTLDSIIRAKEVFDADEFIIITQRFHCERALYIANHFDVHAVCLAVPGPQQGSNLSIRIREMLARVKAMLDLYIFRTQPKFLGPKEPIQQNEAS